MFDRDRDDLDMRRAMDLHRRYVSDEQIRRFEGYVAEIFETFGLDLSTQATEQTPRRFIQALFDATEGYDGDPRLLTVFDNEYRDEAHCRLSQVIEGPIPFFALCEHHALPFTRGMRHYGSSSCSHVERTCEYSLPAELVYIVEHREGKGIYMRLENQVAIITGVSHAGQVGYALAAAFAREGALLAISARNAERVKARAQALHSEGARVIAIPADLTTEEGANTLIQRTLEAYGHIDILVNLAGGLTKYGPSDELTLAEWEAELNNNLRTAFLCSRAVWPTMKSQRSGKILNFSRAGGAQNSAPMMLAYNCAKAGIDALTATFAREGKQFGISVNALGPGVIVTQSNIDSMRPPAEDIRNKWVSLENILEAAIFLVTPAGDGVNGVVLPVQAKGI